MKTKIKKSRDQWLESMVKAQEAGNTEIAKEYLEIAVKLNTLLLEYRNPQT